MWSNDEMKSSVSQHISDIAIQSVHKVTWICILAPSDEMRESNMQRNILFVYVCGLLWKSVYIVYHYFIMFMWYNTQLYFFGISLLESNKF